MAEDPHQMSPEAFRAEVHSFEFWFGAVQGYLEGTEWGHTPGTKDDGLKPVELDRLITTLCNYCVGETAALEGAGGLIAAAPNRATKIFLSTQSVDEGRHLEVLTHRLGELGVGDPEAEIARRAHPSLLAFKRRLIEFVRSGDWNAAIFAQNVILEAMEFTVFQRHAEQADPVTRQVLEGIIKDERRHIGFGENELGRRLKHDPSAREQLWFVRKELDPMVLDSFAEVTKQLDTPASQREDLGRAYLRAVERLGF
jgi:1,2-phenylacetyl-CoA epoxidase catalytic subunit